MSSGTYADIKVVYMTEDDAVEAFDRTARREMDMSGADFLRRWDAGEWADADLDDVPGLVDVWMMLPLVRHDSNHARPNAS
jgi:hypothetical protein